MREKKIDEIWGESERTQCPFKMGAVLTLDVLKECNGMVTAVFLSDSFVLSFFLSLLMQPGSSTETAKASSSKKSKR